MCLSFLCKTLFLAVRSNAVGFLYNFLIGYAGRLTFPKEIAENGSEKASYDVDSGDLIVRVPKAVPGEHFEDLGLMSKLLEKPNPAQVSSTTSSVDKPPIIQVVAEEAFEDSFDWQVEQVSMPEVDSLLPSKPHYGFCKKFAGVFSTLQEDITEICHIEFPDEAAESTRAESLFQREQADFNEDHLMYVRKWISMNLSVYVLTL
jgi:protein SHQ1